MSDRSNSAFKPGRKRRKYTDPWLLPRKIRMSHFFDVKSLTNRESTIKIRVAGRWEFVTDSFMVKWSDGALLKGFVMDLTPSLKKISSYCLPYFHRISDIDRCPERTLLRFNSSECEGHGNKIMKVNDQLLSPRLSHPGGSI
ncbi:hypothetical protein ACFE04_011466 [Oxalis oulophora]